jgi:ATP-dependent helicase/nuclease subunit B
MEDRSDVIPVEKKKDGTFSARSSVLAGEDLRTVSDYVNKKIAGIGREILDGRISLNPCEKGNENACTWCAYKRVCGFEPAIAGYEKRSLEELGKSEALARMQEEL